MIKFWLAALIIIFLFDSSSAFSQNSSPFLKGKKDRPLNFGPQYPILFSRSRFEPDSAYVLPSGNWNFDIQIIQSNSFEFSGNNNKIVAGEDGDARVFYSETGRIYSIYFDTEISERIYRLAIGIGDVAELQLAKREIRFNPGNLDVLIENFHSVLGLEDSNKKRDVADRRRVEIYVWDNETNQIVYQITEPQDEIRNAGYTLGLKFMLLSTQDEALSLKISSNYDDRILEQELNEATNDYSEKIRNQDYHDFNDINYSLNYTSIFDSFSFHAAYSLTFMEQPILEKSPTRFEYFFLGLNYHTFSWLDIILQELIYTSAFPDDEKTTNGTDNQELTMGMRIKITDSFYVETGFVENLFSGPDNIDILFFFNTSIYF